MGGDGKGQLDRRVVTGTLGPAPCRPGRKGNRKVLELGRNFCVFLFFGRKERKIIFEIFFFGIRAADDRAGMRPLRSLCCSPSLHTTTTTPARDSFVMHHTLGVRKTSLVSRETAIGLGWCGSWPLHQARKKKTLHSSSLPCLTLTDSYFKYMLKDFPSDLF